MFGRKKEISFANELERALDDAVSSFENIDALKEMVKTDGWKLVEEHLRKDIQNKLKMSYAMQAEPIKNEKQLMINHAIVECWKRLLTFVHGTINHEQEVLAELRRLAGRE